MSTETESPQNRQSKPEKDKKTQPTYRQVLALGAAGALLVTGLNAGMNRLNSGDGAAEKLHRERVAAEIIANGYDCTLIGVEDTHKQPKLEGMPDNDLRTTVNVTLRIQERPEAVGYFKNYENDNSVAWLSPQPGGTLHFPEGGSTVPVKADRYSPELAHLNLGNEDESLTREVTVKYFPRNTHPEGTFVDLTLRQEVLTADKENSYRTIGTIPCGTMEIKDGTWTVSAIPNTVQPEVHTEASKWQ